MLSGSSAGSIHVDAHEFRKNSFAHKKQTVDRKKNPATPASVEGGIGAKRTQLRRARGCLKINMKFGSLNYRHKVHLSARKVQTVVTVV